MKRFDYDILKKKYDASDVRTSLLLAVAISIAIMSVIGLALLVMFVKIEQINNRFVAIIFAILLMAFFFIITFFLFRYFRKKHKSSFQVFCNELSKLGKPDIIINYVGKLKKKEGAKLDLRFDSVYFYMYTTIPIFKATNTITNIALGTPDPVKSEVIGSVNLIPVVNFTIIRRWNLHVTFQDGTMAVIPVKSKKKGDALAMDLLNCAKISREKMT